MPGLVVIGIPAHNNERHLEEAVGSLLAQTYARTAIVAYDDGSSDDTPALLRRWADDGLIAFERGETPLGLVGGWRRAYALAVARHPDAEYFAWGSDHDVWEPDWAESLVDALESTPGSVLAYPLVDAIGDEGEQVKRRQRRFDTSAMAAPGDRLRALAHARRAGDVIYGLMRMDALRECGEFPSAIRPDRLLLARLAVEGSFVQVPRVLWHRRYREGVVPTISRQRRTLWSGGTPPSSRLPWRMQHALWLLDSLKSESRRVELIRVYVRESRRAAAEQRAEIRERKWRWRRKRARARIASLRRRR
ncbi:MAG TPA: glycosyltransferase family 2 protein [Gaiellaceae bacterium]|nr:glycosyltransferase family 2 protein [Gaiellaceae bacterium]